MNNKKLHTIALFICFLMIMLPIVEAQQLNPPQQTTQKGTIFSDIPRYSKTTIIDISGTTLPNATAALYYKTVKKRETTTNSNGEFKITGVYLADKDNELTLKANDSQGNTAEQTYTVTVDTELPVFKIINFTEIATEQTYNIKAETSKPVNVTSIAKQTNDTTPPDKIINLRKDRIEETEIAISWDKSTALDFFTYGVYRNNKRIAVTPNPYYTDGQISPDKEYDYRITAVDKNCNEAQLSDTLILKSLKSNRPTANEPAEPKLGCEPEEKTIQIDHAGSFTIPVQLQDGANEVTITATDLAGHKIEYVNTTMLDVLPPQIIETNIEQLNPTYIPDVTIKGVLNKKATVFVYLNDVKKPAAYAVANDDGTFQVPVQLRRDIKVTTQQKKVAIETGEGWENNLKIEAVDSAGRKSSQATGKITYSLCGFGSWFDVRIGEPLPKKLTPRFLLQGIQEAGIQLNATYKGRYNVTLGQVTVNPLVMSPDVEAQYDNGIVDINTVTQAQSTKSFLGYLQILFRPWTFSEDTKMSDYDKELNISLHRASTGGAEGSYGVEKYGKGGAAGAPYLASQYKNCLTPGIGCAKLFLEVDIPFQEKIPKQIVDRNTQKTVLKYDLESHVQKSCVPIEMAMDYPVPPKLIPKNFLKGAIKFLDSAVNAIDSVLNPLTTVGTYVLYSCLAGTAWLYIDVVRETWACEAQEYIGKIESIASKEESFDTSVAKAGLCQEIYGSPDKQKAREKCKTCQARIEGSKEFQYEYLQPICDRVACPSAPTIQSHIKNKYNDDVQPVEGITVGNYPDFNKWQVGGKIYAGDDCAFGPYQQDPLKRLSLTYSGRAQGQLFIAQPGISAPIPTTWDFGALGIKDLYDIANNKGPNKGGPTKKDCESYTRPAHPNCCGVSYMKEWAGACGPVPVYDTFDELEQSTCLAAQGANQKLEANNAGLNCGGIANAAAGFCDPDSGGEVIDPIPTGIKYTNTNKPAAARTDEVYILIVPKTMFTRKGGKGATAADYYVYRGYVAERFVTGTANQEKKNYVKPTDGKIEFEVNPKTTVISDGTDLTKFFAQEKKEGKTEVRTYSAEFERELCGTGVENCAGKGRELYDRIYEKIGSSDKDYIVRPDQDGILRSVQCVCLPAVTSYLQFWRGVLGAVRDCFKSILLTGDGSEGVCKAVLSTYVCDLLFDVVKCFVQKFNTPGAGTRAAGGIGDFVGTLTKSGSEVQRRVQGRYGETALWKTMFVDKKLVHSICAFAFTGKWNFDVSGIFQQTVESIPIQSQAFLPKCTRQFISFLPTTEPKGKTTWAYHFGVGLAAGADVRYDLMLKCSSGFRCNPADGFKNGECDCNKKGEQTITIFTPELGTGQLKKNDILNKEIFYTIQADTPDAAVRYDKAVLRYSYTDPKSNKEVVEQAECNIGLTGGDAPNFCAFDPFSLSYRCQFGVGESAVKLNSVKVPYKKQKAGTGIQMYGLTDNINLELNIRQQQPIERARGAEGTKYVFYTLKNQNGKVLREVTEQEQFIKGELQLDSKDGEYTRTITIDHKIDNADFKAGTGQPFTQTMLTKPYSNVDKPQITNTLTTFVADEPNVPFILKFENKQLTIYRANSGSQLSNGEFDKGQKLTPNALSIPQGQVITTYDKTTSTGGTERKKITFFITQVPDDAEILVIPPSAGATVLDPCVGDDKDKQPVAWTVDVAIHDSDRYSKPSQQVSIDPGTGAEARQDNVPVMVICSGNLEPITATQATGTVAQTTQPTTSTTPTTTQQIDLKPAQLKLFVTTDVNGDEYWISKITKELFKLDTSIQDHYTIGTTASGTYDYKTNTFTINKQQYSLTKKEDITVATIGTDEYWINDNTKEAFKHNTDGTIKKIGTFDKDKNIIIVTP